VADIRRQIADGSYDTPEKMDAALDKFLDQYA
jgi:negative regulator of flagellin synthesis FlgM